MPFLKTLQQYIPSSIRTRIATGQERTVRAKKNILAMILFRGINILAGFIMVPMTLHYLNPTNYGLWLTLSSIIAWFGFFDIGLGNGLRNKFAEAMAHDDFHKARVYVSTTYAFLAGIIAVVFVLFFVLQPFLNWYKILNTTPAVTDHLGLIVILTFSFFCLRFVFGLIGTILTADQKPALNSTIEVGSNIVSLGLIWLLVHTTQGSLLAVSVALSFSTTIIPLALSVWLYSGSYKHIRPSFQYVDKRYARELLNLGARFFVLQAGFIIIFSTSNILITQLFSPAEVTPYNIAYKYYNMVSMMFSIILTPFWSAYTEAYTHGDVDWIRRTITVLKRIWYLMAFVLVLLSLGADTFYRLWVGSSITIPWPISVSMGGYMLMIAWCSIYVNFINGTGKIQLQFYATIIGSVVNIPLAIVFVKYFHLGLAGVILAPSLGLLPLCFLWPIQVNKILSGTATGIWNK
jgi:O-antigen/teichoic acid export membrane protein